MALKNVDDLEAIVDVAKEDHVVFVGKAANVRAKLGTGAAKRGLQRRKLMALGAEPLHKCLADGDATAGVGDGAQDRDEVGADGR